MCTAVSRRKIIKYLTSPPHRAYDRPRVRLRVNNRCRPREFLVRRRKRAEKAWNCTAASMKLPHLPVVIDEFGPAVLPPLFESSPEECRRAQLSGGKRPRADPMQDSSSDPASIPMANNSTGASSGEPVDTADPPALNPWAPPLCFFLTHFHSDHYKGLSPAWVMQQLLAAERLEQQQIEPPPAAALRTESTIGGLIFCSWVTRALLVSDLGLPFEHVVGLDFNAWYVFTRVVVNSVSGHRVAPTMRWQCARLAATLTAETEATRQQQQPHQSLQYAPPSSNDHLDSTNSHANGDRLDSSQVDASASFAQGRDYRNHCAGALPSSSSFHVMLLDAGHIPGSCMLLFDNVVLCRADGAAHFHADHKDERGGSSAEVAKGETCRVGRVLVTGDFRVDPEDATVLAQMDEGSAAFQEAPAGRVDENVDSRPRGQQQLLPPGYVDHLYMDTTWLHLKRSSKFLSTQQLESAFDAIAASLLSTKPVKKLATVVARSSDLVEKRDATVSSPEDGGDQLDLLLQATQRADEVSLCAKNSEDGMMGVQYVSATAGDRLPDPPPPPSSCDGSGAAPACWAPPYVLRIHLHNHFGKEHLFQRLALRLGAPLYVDGRRFALLRAVAAEQMQAAREAPTMPISMSLFRSVDEHLQTVSACSNRDGVNALICGYFSGQRGIAESDGSRPLTPPIGISSSHDRTTTAATAGDDEESPPRRKKEGADAHGQPLGPAAGWLFAPAHQIYGGCTEAFDCGHTDGGDRHPPSAGVVEIVGSSRHISPVELARLSAATGVPHFGILATGWARLQQAKDRSTWNRIWHLPYSLHCAPEQLRYFVARLRPKSVLPTHPAALTHHHTSVTDQVDPTTEWGPSAAAAVSFNASETPTHSKKNVTAASSRAAGGGAAAVMTNLLGLHLRAPFRNDSDALARAMRLRIRCCAAFDDNANSTVPADGGGEDVEGGDHDDDAVGRGKVGEGGDARASDSTGSFRRHVRPPLEPVEWLVRTLGRRQRAVRLLPPVVGSPRQSAPEGHHATTVGPELKRSLSRNVDDENAAPHAAKALGAVESCAKRPTRLGCHFDDHGDLK